MLSLCFYLFYYFEISILFFIIDQKGFYELYHNLNQGDYHYSVVSMLFVNSSIDDQDLLLFKSFSYYLKMAFGDGHQMHCYDNTRSNAFHYLKDILSEMKGRELFTGSPITSILK